MIKIAKTTTKNYTIEPIGKVMKCSLTEFLSFRKEHGHKYKMFEKCFICNNKLEPDKEPDLISVTGLGKRFVCNGCYENITDGN